LFEIFITFICCLFGDLKVRCLWKLRSQNHIPRYLLLAFDSLRLLDLQKLTKKVMKNRNKQDLSCPDLCVGNAAIIFFAHWGFGRATCVHLILLQHHLASHAELFVEIDLGRSFILQLQRLC
jgi:hypothetical protein